MGLQLHRLVAVAAGKEPADMVVKGGRVLDVFGGGVRAADVAICDGLIAGVGAYEGREVVQAQGRFVLPGFIEGHIHIESTALAPSEFARVVATRGTTTVIADPHEIANVAGLQGVRYMLGAAEEAPIDLLYAAPSCVPATHMETAGARLGPAEVAEMLSWPGIIGLAEMMNYPGVISGDEEALAKLAAAAGRHVDGHAPGLAGAALQAYVAAGPRTEHEATSLAEAEEKLAAGMWVMIREGSAARNLGALAPLLFGPGAWRCLLVSDDKNPEDLLEQGHLDHCLRRAVAEGVPALAAIRAVTINAATCFGLHDRGAVAPGLLADLVLVQDLESFTVREVFKSGRRINGAWGYRHLPDRGPVALTSSCRLPEPTEQSLAVPAPGADGSVTARVIGIVAGELLTESLRLELAVADGRVLPDPERDVLKLAVIERHAKGGGIGVGFVKGLGLRSGALASTVAHDSHNLVVAGCDDAEMLAAAREVRDMGGGQLVWAGAEDIVRLPLPIAGLMSGEDAQVVARQHRMVREAARRLGSDLADPFMHLSFLALAVIPSLKLTDRGLVDVDAFQIVSVVEGDAAGA